MLPFQLLIAALGGWLHREQADVIVFQREENRVVRARLAGQRLRFDDSERRRLVELGHRLGRRLLGQVATIVTPDTILRCAPAAAVPLACRHTFERWSFGWRLRTRRGATRAFRAR